jgi:hypothetical protein
MPMNPDDITWRTHLAAATVRFLEGQLEWPYRVRARLTPILAYLTRACPRCYHRWGNHMPICPMRLVKRKPNRPWANRS